MTTTTPTTTTVTPVPTAKPGSSSPYKLIDITTFTKIIRLYKHDDDVMIVFDGSANAVRVRALLYGSSVCMLSNLVLGNAHIPRTIFASPLPGTTLPSANVLINTKALLSVLSTISKLKPASITMKPTTEALQLTAHDKFGISIARSTLRVIDSSVSTTNATGDTGDAAASLVYKIHVDVPANKLVTLLRSAGDELRVQLTLKKRTGVTNLEFTTNDVHTSLTTVLPIPTAVAHHTGENSKKLRSFDNRYNTKLLSLIRDFLRASATKTKKKAKKKAKTKKRKRSTSPEDEDKEDDDDEDEDDDEDKTLDTTLVGLSLHKHQPLRLSHAIDKNGSYLRLYVASKVADTGAGDSDDDDSDSDSDSDDDNDEIKSQ
jgi:hypothetical protein